MLLLVSTSVLASHELAVAAKRQVLDHAVAHFKLPGQPASEINSPPWNKRLTIPNQATLQVLAAWVPQDSCCQSDWPLCWTNGTLCCRPAGRLQCKPCTALATNAPAKRTPASVQNCH